MDLMLLILGGVVTAVAGGLLLDRIRGVASRAEGRMARALHDLPDDADRERWLEEFQQLLSEYEGRPLKQYRESREQIRAAKGLARVYAQTSGSYVDPVQEDGMAEDEIAKEATLGSATDVITRSALREALGFLSYRERRVLELRYGLDGKDPRTLEEVGQVFKVTIEGVSRIERQCLKKLQSFIEAQKLREID